LELTPGPGLTLVIGRNGSGKSSFAEALEVLFTEDNQRWAKRSAVWREGWRNLHHADASIDATLAVEGHAGPTTVTRSWLPHADLTESLVEVRPQAGPATDLTFLGWKDAMATYRPFLSYNELGSMFDEGPTKLHDAVSSVLGLEELTDAEKALKDARLERERAVKAADVERAELVALLEGVGDDRASAAIVALRPRAPDFAALGAVLVAGDGSAGAEAELLRRVLAYDPPDEAAVGAAADGLRIARRAIAELVGTQSDELLRGAELLDAALAFRADYPGDSCPVCATPGIVTPEWLAEAREQAERQRREAAASQRAHARATEAQRRARQLVTDVPTAIRNVRPLLDVQSVIEAWANWLELVDELDPDALAAGLEERIGPLVAAVENLQAAAAEELQKREDAWRPVAAAVAAWVSSAEPVFERAKAVRDLKEAETWLKNAALAIRNERFAPIADEAMEIWELLRHRSSVKLGHIELEGTGVRRRVTLDVTIDGVPGAALGVMSQGELHALALSLFFPRATLPESPFRFVVVDDPVQSMDPAKVDGLARVLERAAATRQVLVFTHDDRLYEAVRRLGIAATVVEVARKEESVIELRPALDPVERYLDDARALVRTEELPDDVARRVVPGFCRLALEAACVEAVRRRRIGRGEPHAEVEALLARRTKLNVFAALALFDDSERGGEVLARINNRYGQRQGDVFQAVNRGAHHGAGGDLRDLVRDAAILARELAVLP
jgi:energy-coupling factor transporter ATP-binding protein EcfA2